MTKRAQDRQFNGPPPSILDRLVVVNVSVRRPVRKQLRMLLFACAQPPDWVASGRGISHSLQWPPKRSRREGGVAPHQVLRWSRCIAYCTIAFQPGRIDPPLVAAALSDSVVDT